MLRFITLLTALLLAIPAAAHQQKITISTISHNPRTQMLEVVHRIPLHDAEEALEAQGATAPDIINDMESRRAFVRYLAARFSIELLDRGVELALLGSEIDGGNLIVYQEAVSPGRGTALFVRSQLLTEIWPSQENRVNLGTETQVETLIFKAGDQHKPANLP
ncbi:MAG: DUF6702 family protein [Erythrobacter sp.]